MKQGLSPNQPLEDQLGRRRRNPMGRFYAELVIANNRAVMNASPKAAVPGEIAHRRLQGWVDTGAGYLVLPEVIGDELNLEPHGEINVRYADHRPATRRRVSNVWLQLLGRHSVFSAILEPARDTALIGAIVLEELDLLVDPFREILVPRDPDRFVAEIE